VLLVSDPSHKIVIFSRGTFTDSQLRRKLKEQTFEMSVLEGLNSESIEKYSNWLAENNNNEENVSLYNKKKESIENFGKYLHYDNNVDTEESDDENTVVVQVDVFSDTDEDFDEDDEVIGSVEPIADRAGTEMMV
jgi:hypothetical protein